MVKLFSGVNLKSSLETIFASKKLLNNVNRLKPVSIMNEAFLDKLLSFSI